MHLSTRILVDGCDPGETLLVKQALGCVDGQTTNPSLIARNPEVKRLIASGHTLSEAEENAEYRKIVQTISPLVENAGVSIEVFADLGTTADQMVRQGREMFTWIPNAYIKYPCTKEGLKAAERSVAEGIRVNMTLCFSQEQAAAVYAATKGSRLIGASYALAHQRTGCFGYSDRGLVHHSRYAGLVSRAAWITRTSHHGPCEVLASWRQERSQPLAGQCRHHQGRC